MPLAAIQLADGLWPSHGMPHECIPASFDASPVPETAIQLTDTPTGNPHDQYPPVFDAEPVPETEMQLTVPEQPVPDASPVPETASVEEHAS